MSYHIKVFLPTFLAAQLIIWAPTTFQAAELPSSEPSSGAGSRQKAETVLRKVSEFYSKLKAFSFELATEAVVKVDAPDAADAKIEANFNVSMKRPNKLSIVETSGMPILDEQSDGKNVYIYSSELKKYVVNRAGSTLQAVLRDPTFHSGYGCLKVSVLDALLSDIAVNWSTFAPVPEVNELTYVGEDSLDGIAVDKLEIKGPKFDELIYVDRSEKPWIRRITSTDRTVADLPVPPDSARMLALSATVEYKHPVADPSLADSKFKFKSPSDAVEAASFAAEEPLSPLVGTAAGDFNGELIEGKLMKLSQFKKEKIVLLDFWATWCGPCRRALPLVSQVAEDYKKKGVVFFAVNEQEDKGKVQEYLQKNNLAMSVVLDRDGAIGRQYKADAIPTTVVIDRRGVIRVVHRGFSPDIAKELSFQLDQILGLRKTQH